MEAGIAVKAFIVKDEKVLAIKRAEDEAHAPRVWELPGGRLEKGENPYEGLRRETFEETGLDISIIHPLNIQHFTRDDGQVITMIIFYCRPLVQETRLSHEHSKYRWVALNECKQKLSHYFHKEVEIFQKIKDCF